MTEELREVEFTGGVHFGENYYAAMNATWPFAHLVFDENQIKLGTTFFGSFDFPKTSVTRLSRYAGFFSVGLQIEHNVRNYSPFVVFWTFNFAKVKATLVECGYNVEDGRG